MQQRIRVAILATSFGRLVQAVGFQRHPGFELVAIAGRDAEKTHKIAAEMGIATAYGDWRELLRRESPGLVCVVTPVHLHHDMFLAAVAAKHEHGLGVLPAHRLDDRLGHAVADNQA